LFCVASRQGHNHKTEWNIMFGEKKFLVFLHQGQLRVYKLLHFFILFSLSSDFKTNAFRSTYTYRFQT